MIFKDTTGQVHNFGSGAGYSFLSQNPEINIKFRDHFGMYLFYIKVKLRLQSLLEEN